MSETQKRLSWEQLSGATNRYMFSRHSPATDERLGKESTLSRQSGLLEAAIPLQLPTRHTPISVTLSVEKVREGETRH